MNQPHRGETGLRGVVLIALLIVLLASLAGTMIARSNYQSTPETPSSPSSLSSTNAPGSAFETGPAPENSQAKAAPLKSPLSLLFVGDMMFDRSVWIKMKASGLDYPFQKLDTLLADADLTIGNLEGPVTDRGQHAVPNGVLLFRFESSVLAPLKETGLDIVSLANNHTHNQGATGLADTRQALEEAGLTYFGDPRLVSRELSVATVDKNGWKIAFVGWNTIEVADDGQDALVDLITDLEDEVDLTIVMPHWGNEYKKQTTAQIEAAQALVTAGADLIIGAHPHVVQGMDIIQSKPVVYSLGNFIFDQYWSEPTQEGLAVKVNLNSQAITSLNYIPIDLHKSQPRRAEIDIRDSVFGRAMAATNESLQESLKAGLLTLPASDTLH